MLPSGYAPGCKKLKLDSGYSMESCRVLDIYRQQEREFAPRKEFTPLEAKSAPPSLPLQMFYPGEKTGCHKSCFLLKTNVGKHHFTKSKLICIYSILFIYNPCSYK